MNKISTDIYIHIYSFLDIKNIKPLNKFDNIILKTNPVWEERCKKKFNVESSINYYKEFQWQIKLKKHQENYKRRWTSGCVGKINPLFKSTWKKAPNLY